jgi:hypothetical protein
MGKKKKLLFLLLEVIGPYVKRRVLMAGEKFLEKHEKDQQEREGNSNDVKVSMTAYDELITIIKKLLHLTSFCDKLYALASFLNLAIFIHQGTPHPNL